MPACVLGGKQVELWGQKRKDRRGRPRDREQSTDLSSKMLTGDVRSKLGPEMGMHY